MKKYLLAFILYVALHGMSIAQAQNCNFTYTQTPGLVGAFNFVGPTTSFSPNLYYYSWSFGDSTAIDTSLNPNHLFSTPGSYIVCISVYSISQNTLICSTCNTINVSFTPFDCSINFFPAVNTPNAYLFYSAIDSTQGYTVLWNFGDGTSSNEYSNTHQFSQAGTYAVTLTVYDGNGTIICTSSVSIVINPVPVDCSFSQTSISDVEVAFLPIATFPGNTQFLMEYGDGTSDSNFNGTFNHIYPGTGLYNACITVSQPGLPSCTSCQNVSITQVPIDTISCNIVVFQNPIIQGEYTFNLGAVANQAIWHITFPDGSIDTIVQNNSSQLIYQFPASGTYIVSITNINSNQTLVCTNSVIITVQIVIPANNCIADFYAATSPLLGYFIDISQNIVPQTTTYAWSFGDGSTSAERFPYHSYTMEGLYTVTLIINDGSCSDTIAKNVSILGLDTIPVVDTCNAFFIVTQASAYSVDVVNLSSGSNLTFNWVFTPGTNFSSPFPITDIPFSNSYNFCLTVSGENNCSSTYCDSVSFDSTGVLLRPSSLLHINVLGPQQITGFDVTGIESKTEISKANCFPNPFSNSFTIDSGNGKYSNYKVLSVDGRILKTEQLSNKIEMVDSQNWNSGIYILQLQNSNGELETFKIIKK